jgi:hypothetical protein
MDSWPRRHQESRKHLANIWQTSQEHSGHRVSVAPTSFKPLITRKAMAHGEVARFEVRGMLSQENHGFSLGFLFAI